jgi:tetratricopeptide (TPR) repeat protein
MPPSDNQREILSYVQTARSWEIRGNYEMALELYTKAWERAVLSNRADDKFTIALAIARSNRRLGNDDAYAMWMENAAAMTDTHHPERQSALTLCAAEAAMSAGEYSRILGFTTGDEKGDDALRAQILGYRVQAKVLLDQEPGSDLSTLSSLAARLDHELAKGRISDPAAVSFAYYAIGYAQYHSAHADRALRAFQNAYRIDQTYELFPSLADDLLMMGYCHQQLGQNEDAYRTFLESSQIYRQLGDTVKADKASAETRKK